MTGLSAPYYTICEGCTRPSGRQHHVDQPELPDLQGRRHHDEQALQPQLAGRPRRHLQDNPQYFPYGTASFINPTGIEFQPGHQHHRQYLVKAQGSYTFPWDINVSGNFNWNQGATQNALDQRSGRRLRRHHRQPDLQHTDRVVAKYLPVRSGQAARPQRAEDRQVPRRQGAAEADGWTDSTCSTSNTIQSYVSGNQSTGGLHAAGLDRAASRVPLRRVDPVLGLAA